MEKYKFRNWSRYADVMGLDASIYVGRDIYVSEDGFAGFFRRDVLGRVVFVSRLSAGVAVLYVPSMRQKLFLSEDALISGFDRPFYSILRISFADSRSAFVFIHPMDGVASLFDPSLDRLDSDLHGFVSWIIGKR